MIESKGFEMKHTDRNSVLVPSRHICPLIREILANGQDVKMQITGGSMLPFLAGRRDNIVLSPIFAEPKRGDIVFYQRDNGQYILHRIWKSDRKGRYHLIGDAQKLIEYPVRRDQIFAVVKSAERKGKTVTESDMIWKFFSTVWLILRPFRRFIMMVFVNTKGALYPKCDEEL